MSIARSNSLGQLTTTVSNTGQLAGMRNRIINGDMRISQRYGLSVIALPINAWAYSVDRILVAVNGVPAQFFQNTGNYGVEGGYSANSIMIVGAAGVTNPQISQKIEAVNCRDMAGKSVVFSTWVYQDSGAALTASASISRASSLDNFNTNVVDVTLTCVPATIPSAIWTKVIATGTLSSAAITGLWPTLKCSGSVGSGKVCQFSNMQFELGSVATPFEQRSYGLELSLCQRYFEKSFPIDVAPSNGPDATSFSTNNGLVKGIATNRMSQGTSYPFKVIKRVTPTMVGYGNSNGAAASIAANDTALAFSYVLSLGAYASDSGFQFGQQFSDGTFLIVMGHYTASAEL